MLSRLRRFRYLREVGSSASDIPTAHVGNPGTYFFVLRRGRRAK
jgi:hypothetical protein